MIYLHKDLCLIIIRPIVIIIIRNTTCILNFSFCHKQQQQRYHNENIKICMFIHYMFVDILFPPTKAIPIMFEHSFHSNKSHSNYVWTHYKTLETWIVHNGTRYHNFNPLRHALPYIFLSLTRIDHNAICYHNFNILPHALPYSLA